MFSPYEEPIGLRSARKTNLQRSRALTTIYGARLSKIKRKKTRTAVEDRSDIMLKNEIVPKASLSPFSPLPAIGKVTCDSRLHDKTKDTKVIVFDITKSDQAENSVKLEVLKPLTPLRVNGYHRKMSVSSLDSKPQQLLRENTYDVIKPIFLSAPKVAKRDSSLPRRTLTPMVHSGEDSAEETNTNAAAGSTRTSARSRFRKAATDVGKLSCVPETGKLLCLREKLNLQPETEEERRGARGGGGGGGGARRAGLRLPVSPTQKLNKLSEIFQSLEVKGRHRDKMKKENNWF